MSAGPYEVRITRREEKDIKALTPKLRNKLYDILTEVIAKGPFCGKKLIGDLEGSYSYLLARIYEVDVPKWNIKMEPRKNRRVLSQSREFPTLDRVLFTLSNTEPRHFPKFPV